jgi:hypothetical protein
VRNLATIQTIKSLDPIEGKDKIVLASFVNVDWKVIVGKADFQVGDRCIYVEYDSILPQKPEFEFLRKRCWNEKWQGFRIRNMKMAGTYSQGIAFPINILTSLYFIKENVNYVYKDGDDITDRLGIIKYDPEAREEAELLERNKKKYGPFMRFLLRFPFIKNILYPKKTRGDWPVWAHKSDETRVQILPYVYEDYKGVPCYVTEKVDGQSSLFGLVRGKFTVCSRNINLSKPSRMKGKYATEKSKYWEVAEKFDIEKKLRKASKKMGIDLYVQGEQCGPTIQGNKLELKELSFFVFNVYDVTHGTYFSFNDMVEFCATYHLDMTPLLLMCKFNWNNAEELIEYAKGNSVLNNQVLREGIVIRSIDPMPPGDKMSNMMSFKVINPDFDLKYNKENE